MDPADAACVRRFNRLVTQRAGALDDYYLARERPLGQARVLWEIGPGGSEIGAVRQRLDIDAAQLSRCLRALEDDGLVVSRAGVPDSRVRVASLTGRGLQEWRALDAASTDAARGILEPLTAEQRTRLVLAMREVEVLLVASLVRIRARPPSDHLSRACLRAYFAEIGERFGTTVEQGGADGGLAGPDSVLLVAVLRAEAVGCAGLLVRDGEPPEIKRLWTAPAVRGMGIARRLLGAVEDVAAGLGARTVRLDTHRALTEARSLYRSTGYAEIGRYNDNPHAHHWFEKSLLPTGRPAS